jgi:hypothetical protein
MAYTTIDNPELYFQTKLYTGNSSTQSITFDGSENMQPDWVWCKSRGQADNHAIFDSVRGGQKQLRSNTSDDEFTRTNAISSFDSDGFTMGDQPEMNSNSVTYVAWNWKAGTSFTNDASSTGIGTIDSTGSVNDTAGFSIVSYTGNGSAGATVKHGLSAVPSTIILKSRSTNGAQWTVYHQGLGNTKGMQLDTTAAAGTSTLYWNDTTPSSTVFTLGAGGDPNGSGGSLIAYCFAEKKGYSKFGSYTGNGNADGTFVYTGFKPAWIMFKKTSGTASWYMYDSKRLGYTGSNYVVAADLTNAEISGKEVDLLSNGFKWRNTTNNGNASGGEYVYWAFAESPFVNSNGIPNNAR